jgi:hypothetical protein
MHGRVKELFEQFVRDGKGLSGEINCSGRDFFLRLLPGGGMPSSKAFRNRTQSRCSKMM